MNTISAKKPLQPWFLCHGAPTIAIENNAYTKFLEKLGKSTQPKAIVIFTAHWESRILTVSCKDDTYDTIYDFGGFQKELYQIKYKAKGSTAIAKMLIEKFKDNKIDAKADTTRGLDHGSWTLLYRLFPKAEYPVIQVSVNSRLPSKDQIKIGEVLRDLGKEDILVIGSGVTTHNFGEIDWDATEAASWAKKFDDFLIEKAQKNDLISLSNYMSLAPYAKLAVPTAEHFVPFLICAGAGDPTSTPKVLYRDYIYSSLSQLCVEF